MWINEENIFSPEEYESLQREFFYLLRLKKILLSEGKSAKYENIMAENIKIADAPLVEGLIAGVAVNDEKADIKSVLDELNEWLLFIKTDSEEERKMLAERNEMLEKTKIFIF